MAYNRVAVDKSSKYPFVALAVLALVGNACVDATGTAPAANPEMIRSAVAPSGTKPQSAVSQEFSVTGGRLEFLKPAGPAPRVAVFPARQALDFDSLRTALKAQLADLNRPDRRARRGTQTQRQLDLAARLLNVKSRQELDDLFAASRSQVARRQSVSATDASGNQQKTVTLSLLGRDALRLHVSQRLLTRQSATRVGNVSLDELPCEYYEEAPDWCIEGYDENYNGSSDETEVAAQESEAQAVQVVVDGEDDLTEACNGERTAYYVAVGAFVGSAAQTLYWIYRKNPLRVWESMQQTAATLAAVNIAHAFLMDCLAE